MMHTLNYRAAFCLLYCTYCMGRSKGQSALFFKKCKGAVWKQHSYKLIFIDFVPHHILEMTAVLYIIISITLNT